MTSGRDILGRVRRVLFGAALALVMGSPALAQSWLAVGPPGGDVRALANDPRDARRVYLGTGDGVLYRSDDAGIRWHRMAPGFPRRGVSLDEIVVDPRGILYVGYWEVSDAGGGIARSLDGGRTFAVLEGIEGHAVRGLALSPSHPDVLVAGTMTGVYLSPDRGETWRRISPEGHADIRNVGSVAVDPRTPRIIYAGTWHLPWKTVDGGATWFPIHTGMIDDSDVMTLTLDPRDPGKVIATACSGIYQSSDGAARWTKVRGIPSSSRRTKAFRQSPDDPNVLLAGTVEGLWMSRDAGASWRQGTQKELSINAIVALPGGTVLLGTEGAGVVRSVDGGNTWAASNAGFSERFVSRVVFDRVGRRLLAAIWGDRKHGGVFSAGSPRGPWVRVGTGLFGREVLSLAPFGMEFIAGTDDGLFVSSGAAGQWRRLPTLLNGIDVHPRVLDLVTLGDRRIVAATSRGLLRSGDGGRTWVRPRLGLSEQVTALAVAPSDVNHLIASTALGLFRSRDGGDTWVSLGSAFAPAVAHSLAFVPMNDDVVYAATGQGLYRSRDQGVSWARCTGGIPFADITGLAVSADGRTLWASEFSWGGVFRSSDGGETWERVAADGLASERVWSLAFDPWAPERVLAAAPAGGLHLFVPPPPATAAAGSE